MSGQSHDRVAMLHILKKQNSNFFINVSVEILATIGEACHDIEPELATAFENTKSLRLDQLCFIAAREGYVRPSQALTSSRLLWSLQILDYMTGWASILFYAACLGLITYIVIGRKGRRRLSSASSVP